ncbi:Alpha/Beta hydrolase protein [Umbelopsis sp. AD052]|nr:Alpha/Beta hydrolase protein [Umbelopsis sp. AD052]
MNSLIEAAKKKSVQILPEQTRYNLLRFVFDLPLPLYRSFIEFMTVPVASQKPWIKSMKGDGWQGSWYGKDAANVEDVDKWTREARDEDLILVWIHGGGFCVGNDIMYSAFYIKILENLKTAHSVNARILSVNYVRTPEAIYPKQRDECMGCYNYLIKDLGIDPKKVIIGGDSAGGNLTAVILQHLKPETFPAGAILVSPWINLETTSPTYTSNRSVDCIGIKNLNNCISRYVPEDMTINDPELSPIYAEEFKGHPPLFVTYGGLEVFKHDIKEFIRRNREDGVDVEELTRSMPHIWIMQPEIPCNDAIWEEDVSKLTDWCASKLKL